MSGSILKAGRYLLDTNTAIAALNNKLDLQRRLDESREVFLNTTVVTRDGHFDEVDGLPTEQW